MATQAPFWSIGQTPVYKISDGSYLYLAGMDIDGDGSGGNPENDPDFQESTTYQPSQNARTVPGIVIPGILQRSVSGVVIGCKARVTHVLTGFRTDAVAADIGPDDKIGEAFIRTAQILGIPSSPVSGGTQEPLFLYEFWPGIPAVVGGITYNLQPRQ
jgi:hypothetical protein